MSAAGAGPSVPDALRRNVTQVWGEVVRLVDDDPAHGRCCWSARSPGRWRPTWCPTTTTRPPARWDPGFEVRPLLYNPLRTDPEVLVRLLPSRLEVLGAELDQPVGRLRAWGFVAPEPGPGAVAEALRPR